MLSFVTDPLPCFKPCCLAETSFSAPRSSHTSIPCWGLLMTSFQPRLGSCSASNFSLALPLCCKVTGKKFPFLGPCSVSLLAACVLQCLMPLLAACVIQCLVPLLAACLRRWFGSFLAACVIRWAGAAGSTFHQWVRPQKLILEAWVHTPRTTATTSWERLKGNWQVQDINVSERSRT